MAMTAWSANVLTSSICLSVNGRTSMFSTTITPMTAVSLSIGTARFVRVSAPTPWPAHLYSASRV